jgi:hypothetical protein
MLRFVVAADAGACVAPSVKPSISSALAKAVHQLHQRACVAACRHRLAFALLCFSCRRYARVADAIGLAVAADARACGVAPTLQCSVSFHILYAMV